MASDDATLSGIELEQLMDCLEADFEENGSDEEIDLLARLRARPLRADSMESIDRLHALWMIAGDPAAARAVIDIDGAALLRATRPGAQAEIRLMLALQRLHIAEYVEEEDAVRDALSQMRAIVAENPSLDVCQCDRLPVFDRLEYEFDSLDVALETIALRHAFELAMEGDAVIHGRDEANHQCRRALAFSRHGCDDKARAAAMVALQAVSFDQDVEVDDWLHLAGMLTDIIPEQVDAFRQKMRQFAT